MLEDLWHLFQQKQLQSPWALMFLLQGATEADLRSHLGQRFGYLPEAQRQAFFEHFHFFSLPSLLFNELSALNEAIAKLNVSSSSERKFFAP